MSKRGGGEEERQEKLGKQQDPQNPDASASLHYAQLQKAICPTLLLSIRVRFSILTHDNSRFTIKCILILWQRVLDLRWK